MWRLTDPIQRNKFHFDDWDLGPNTASCCEGPAFIATRREQHVTDPEPESDLLHDWRFTANHYVLASSPWRLTTSSFFNLNTCSYSPYVPSSVTTEWGLAFTIAAGPRQRSHSRIQVPRDSWNILLSRIRDSLNLEDQVPLFISPTNRVTQL
jgi:hypothetical protein